MRARTTRVVAAMAVVYLVWGSTYLAIKIGVDTIPPMLLGAVRFLLAGVLLYAWAARGAPRPTRSQWWGATVTGTLMLVGGNGAVTVAEQRIDSGVAALLIATVPLWMAVMAWLRYGERLRPVAVAGLVVGFGGVALLVRPTGDGTDLALSLLVVLGAFLWAAGSVYVRSAPLPSRGMQATAMQMLAGGAVFALLSVLAGEPWRVDQGGISAASLWALAYLAIAGSLLAFSAYTWLLRNAPAATVSTYAYVNPVVAVLLGAAVLAEPITPRMAAAGVAILTGVGLIVTGRLRAVPVAPRTAVSAQTPSAAESPRRGPVPVGCTRSGTA